MQAVSMPVVKIKSVMFASSYHTMISKIPLDFFWIRKKENSQWLWKLHSSSWQMLIFCSLWLYL